MKKTDFQLNKRIEGIQKISIKYHGKILERFFDQASPILMHFELKRFIEPKGCVGCKSDL